MSLIDKLTIDDLATEQRQLAEVIGIEAYRRLVEAYSGSYVYVQKIDTVTAQLRNAELLDEFNGYNYLELAKKYNLSESSVRRIVTEKLSNMRYIQPDEQLSFFDR